MDFGGGKDVKTRKPHRCEWCYQPIEVGSSAYNYRGMFEDEWQNWYMHPECHFEMTQEDDGYGDGFEPGSHERPVLAAGRK